MVVIAVEAIKGIAEYVPRSTGLVEAGIGTACFQAGIRIPYTMQIIIQRTCDSVVL